MCNNGHKKRKKSPGKGHASAANDSFVQGNEWHRCLFFFFISILAAKRMLEFRYSMHFRGMFRDCSFRSHFCFPPFVFDLTTLRDVCTGGLCFLFCLSGGAAIEFIVFRRPYPFAALQ